MIPEDIQLMLLMAQKHQDIVEAELNKFNEMMKRKETPPPDFWQTRHRAERSRDLLLGVIQELINEVPTKK